MSLGLRDLITTVMAAVTAGVLYVQDANLSTPILSSNRGAAAIMLVMGVSMCAAGSTKPDPKAMAKPNGLSIFMGTLGGLAFIAGAWALITGSQFMVMALGGVILLMWFIATFRHAFATRQPA